MKVNRSNYRMLVAKTNAENAARRTGWRWVAAQKMATEDPKAMPRQFRTDLRAVTSTDWQ